MNKKDKTKRKITTTRLFPVVALCVGVGIAALTLFFLYPTSLSDSPQQVAMDSEIDSAVDRTTTSTTATTAAANAANAAAEDSTEAAGNTLSTQTNTQATKHAGEAAQENRQQQLARLIEQRFTPAMKQQINQLLAPAGRVYREQPAVRGGMIDLSGRASSVTIAVLDDDGELLVADITSPLAEQPAADTAAANGEREAAP